MNTMILEHTILTSGPEVFTTFIGIMLDPEMGEEGVCGFQNNFDGKGTRAYFMTLIF